MPITSADIVPFNKVRSDLTRLADEVRAGHEKIITRNGESYVALVDARKLDYYHQLERDKQARAALHLGVLNDAISGLQDIRDGKPSLSLESARKRSQAKLNTAIAARKARP
ncbi:MAG: type II toxin-antitoxin system Phd/YefM family antitoxin [Thermomonas sp.]|uniref:type II toxin-antitoxin system Phd/YefM family antitoxin n=1 Tax=Thermomonas sp. TaxID=1971895 RepID=UPI001EBD6387|nr:type II toxin-antitoxin system Phd/YefM family antitoxin [Thermomonas sp.]MBV2208778.1 type II toxin-antitoxin system Phd/YefM family antitoxin [Thermomonas sp.]